MTYDVAQPILKVYGKSTLTIDGKEIDIKSGEFWMDRQIYDYHLTKTGDLPLYVGTWIHLRLSGLNGDDDNQYSFALVNIWSNTYPVDTDDHYIWQSGTESGYSPILAEGNVFYPIPDKIEKYYQMNNGGKYLDSGDFAINILNTSNPSESPHWTSPTTGNTYTTAWKIDIKVDYSFTVYMFAMVDQCEFGNTIWEGATLIYSDPEQTELIGYGWAEQMGYN